MHWLDWIIVFSVVIFLVIFALWSKKFNESVADFLAANRCAGRYILAVAEGAAALGAISILAVLEQGYTAGFAHGFWSYPFLPLVYIASMTGWVVYRFRETRALTLAQFFEMRYSRKFRIFAGGLCFISGIVNFGVFPAFTTSFFIHFCGFPESIHIMGINFSVFALFIFALLALSLFFTFVSGQIGVMVTDFLQGIITLLIFAIIVGFFLLKFNFNSILETMASASLPGKSMINPFDTSEVHSFNIWFYFIAYLGMFYNFMGWQASQGYNASAKSPHEARMGRIIGTWRGYVIWSLATIVPVAVYMVMNSPEFEPLIQNVNSQLDMIKNPNLARQMTVPIALRQLLPIGLLGGLSVVMICTSLATFDSNLHSWGSIFIQDVIIPIRGKILSPKQHIKALRLSIIGVAVFVFFWSLLFEVKDYLFMYFSVTSAIFLGGAGSAIIGGLYWKRGTTSAAFSAMIVGSSLAIAGIIIKFKYPDFFLNGQYMYGISMFGSIITYIFVSLIGPGKEFNLDKMLHRGVYEKNNDHKADLKITKKWKKRIGISSEFTKTDIFLYIWPFVLPVIFFFCFFIILGIYFVRKQMGIEVPFTDNFWIKAWKYAYQPQFLLVPFVIVWLLWGGCRDIKDLFSSLITAKRNETDDGRVPPDEKQNSAKNEKIEEQV